MAYKSSSLLHRDLTDAEEAEFRATAREKYKPGTGILEVWHPVYRDECTKMNLEVAQGANVKVVDVAKIKALAKEAIQVQDASNLRGVLLSWHKAICEPSVVRGGQVEEFLNILYLSKVTSLLHATTDGIGSVEVYSSANNGPDTDFRMAYEWAIRTTGEG